MGWTEPNPGRPIATSKWHQGMYGRCPLLNGIEYSSRILDKYIELEYDKKVCVCR